MIYTIIHDNAPSVVNHEPSAETYLCIILQYSVVNYTVVLYTVKWNSYQYALIEEFYITLTVQAVYGDTESYLNMRSSMHIAYRVMGLVYTTLTWCEQTNKIFPFYWLFISDVKSNSFYNVFRLLARGKTTLHLWLFRFLHTSVSPHIQCTF